MVKLQYKKFLVKQIEEADLDYSIEEEEVDGITQKFILIDMKKRIFGRSYIITNNPQMVEAVLPALKKFKAIAIHDHLNYEVTDDDMLFISCYGDTLYKDPASTTINKSIHSFTYKGIVTENRTGQRDNYFYEPIKYFTIMIKDDNDQPLGFIMKNKIHFFFDIFHTTLREGHIKLVADAVKKVIYAQEKLKDLYEQYSYIIGVQNFINLLQKQHSRNLRGMASEIETLEDWLEEVRKDIVEKTKRLNELTVQYNALKKEIDKIDFEKMAQELIVEYNVDFDSEGNIIRVTPDIYIEVEPYGKVYMGKYKIVLNAIDATIKIYNLTYPDFTYPHPHVSSSHNFCFGSINDDVAKLLSEYKYLEVFDLCEQMLYFYNPHGAYTDIRIWYEEQQRQKETTEDELASAT